MSPHSKILSISRLGTHKHTHTSNQGLRFEPVGTSVVTVRDVPNETRLGEVINERMGRHTVDTRQRREGRRTQTRDMRRLGLNSKLAAAELQEWNWKRVPAEA